MTCPHCAAATVEAVAEMSGRGVRLDREPSPTGEWLIVDRQESETLVVQLVPAGSPGALAPHRCPKEGSL